MSKSTIRDVVTLTREGWRPYNATPAGTVYDGLGCPSRTKANWFVREDVFCCVGCSSRCSLTRPAGFPLPLPIKYPAAPPDRPYNLTPREMADRLHVLTAKQAAYCLNISERLVYDWIAEGKLIRLRENPVRVRAEEIRRMMQDFDE